MKKQDWITFGFIALLSIVLLSPRQTILPDKEVRNEGNVIRELSPVISSVGPTAAMPTVKKETLTTRFLNLIPTEAEIAQQENHFTPQGVIDGGVVIGKVVEQLQQDPKLVNEGLDFFGECAMKSDVPVAVRAVCFRRLKDWSVKSKLTAKVTEKDVPDFVAKLSNEIPSEIE